MIRQSIGRVMGALVLVGVLAGIACAAGLTGAGATFPYPLYSKWFDEYGKSHKGININYQSIGSGGGIRQITDRTVDFGASDAVMSEEQMAKAPGIMHFPTVIGAVVLVYNLPAVKSPLTLDGETVAGIFLGHLATWNDPRIAALNPGVALPATAIIVVHRSDGSGTTNIFTDYLSHVSTDWAQNVGKNTSVNWPAGLGAKGNEGVAGQVKNLEGSIGYVELAYASANKLAMASVKNRSGIVVVPTVESTTQAAASVARTMPADMRVSIVNSPVKNAYPIAGFTYLLLYREQKDAAKGKQLVDFIEWSMKDGQKFAAPLLYAPLPGAIVARVEARLKTVTANGKPLLP